MKRLLQVMMALAIAGSASCATPSNPLIGTWKLDPEQDAGCKTPLVFGATTLTSPDPWGKTSSIPISYTYTGPETYPLVVYIVTDAGVAEHVTYRFSSRNKMVEETMVKCAYTRG